MERIECSNGEKMVAISIIMPVYNSEKYIEKTIENTEESKPISAPRKRNSILNDIDNEDEVGIRVTDEELELKAKNRSRDILQQINRYMKEK